MLCFLFFFFFLLQRLAREILATTPLQHLLSVFILACISNGNPKGQQTLLQSGLSFKDLTAPHLLHGSDPRLRRWSCLCIAKMWQGFGHAKSLAAQDQTPELLCQLLMDPVPDVRCAALYALGTFFGGKTAPPAGANTTSPTGAQRHMQMLRAQQRLDLEVQLGQIMSTLINDGSPVVRRELMIALAELIYFQQDLFLAIATAHPRNRESISPQGWHIWRAILRGCRDCSSQVQEAALAIKGFLKGRAILNQSQLGRMIGSQHNPGLQLHANRDRIYGGYGGGLHDGIEGIEEEGGGGGAQDSRRNSLATRETSVSERNSSISSSRSGGGASSTTNVASEQSIAHIDHDDTSVHGEDGAPLPTATHDSRPALVQPPMQQQLNKNMPPIRHFNRYKMGHLRPGPGGPGLSGAAGGAAAASAANAGLAGGAGGQRRSSDKSSIIRSMESSDAGGGAKADAPAGSASGAGTLDERAADQMWQVPKSRVFEDSYAQFAEPMLVPTSDQIVPTMVRRNSDRRTKARSL